MKIILVHQKPTYLQSAGQQRLVAGIEFVGHELPAGTFGGNKPVLVEVFAHHVAGQMQHGSIVFVHANDTVEWGGQGRLKLGSISEYCVATYRPITAMLPLTVQEADSPSVNGNVRRYGTASLEHLLVAVMSGRVFADEAEVLECLSGPQETVDADLFALSIMCQGYLAVHAAARLCGERLDGTENQEESALIGDALRAMGWVDLIADSPTILDIESIAAHRKEVRQRTWWRTVFPSGADGPTADLLERVLGTGDEVQPESVASTYLELSRSLSA